MDRTARGFLIAELVWLVPLGIGVVCRDEIWATFWIAAGLWWGAISGAGAILASFALAALVRAERSRRAALVVAVVVPVAAAGLVALVGDEPVVRARFALVRGRYQARVDRILAAPPGERDRVAGRDCRLDPGPPLRVAFILPGGFLDNYSAIVYDPTGAVLQANRVRTDPAGWTDPRLAPVRGLFGGTLFFAIPLGGSWYRCGFT